MKDVRDFLALTPRIALGLVLLNLVVLTASAHADLGQAVDVSVPPAPSARSNAALAPQLGGTSTTASSSEADLTADRSTRQEEVPHPLAMGTIADPVAGGPAQPLKQASMSAVGSAEPVTTEPAANDPAEGAGPVTSASTASVDGNIDQRANASANAVRNEPLTHGGASAVPRSTRDINRVAPLQATGPSQEDCLSAPSSRDCEEFLERLVAEIERFIDEDSSMPDPCGDPDGPLAECEEFLKRFNPCVRDRDSLACRQIQEAEPCREQTASPGCRLVISPDQCPSFEDLGQNDPICNRFLNGVSEFCNQELTELQVFTRFGVLVVAFSAIDRPQEGPIAFCKRFSGGGGNPEPSGPGGRPGAGISGKLVLASNATAQERVGVVDPGGRGDRASAATRRESSRAPRRGRERGESSESARRTRGLAATGFPAIVALALGVTLAAVGVGTRLRS